MDPTSQVFCLRWNNHRNNLLAVFDHLLQVNNFFYLPFACCYTHISFAQFFNLIYHVPVLPSVYIPYLNKIFVCQQTEAFCDVTIACDGASVKCHKMILSACSAYFQQLFMENTCDHPIVFLKDIKYEEIRAILDYMYKGEVNVAQDHLPGLLKVAELLKVKGLVEEEREKLLNSGTVKVTANSNNANLSSSSDLFDDNR